MSWHRAAGRCAVWFNRDERLERAAEIPPAQRESTGVRFVAPLDGTAGGTWILINEFGLTVCLLNDYASDDGHREVRAHSRGLVVLACAAARNLGEVSLAVEGQPLGRTPPFQLLALEAEGSTLVMHWDRRRLESATGRDIAPPLTSSSFATLEVSQARQRRFAALVPDIFGASAEQFERFHFDHEPDRGAHSVLMRRPDACTRSITRTRVDATQCELVYQPVTWAAEISVPPTIFQFPRRSL